MIMYSSLLDRAIRTLMPTVALEGTGWLSAWLDKDRKDFLVVARVMYPLISLAYVLHFFMFDRPMKLEPTQLWMSFRFSMAALAAVLFLLYLSPSFTATRYYKAPAMLAGLVFCYFQGRVLVWYDQSVYFYCFGFAIVATILLRSTVTKSVGYAALLLAVQWNSFHEAAIGEPLLYSATAITLIFVVFARSGYAAELRYFIAEQKNTESQRKLIELNIDFTDRLKAFLPKRISQRLSSYIERNNMTVLQAIEEVLHPKQRIVACLFSDIRGFTQSTKKSDDFLRELVLPNVKECTRAIEENGGIPRKIGDLIFAYFDEVDPVRNLLGCIRAGLAISRINDVMISRPEVAPIRRHVLISTGSAMVGNLGGFDSSIEITALGNPVNFLSRVDEITKHPRIKPLLSVKDLILDTPSASILRKACPDMELRRIELPQFQVSLRDFEDVRDLWILTACELSEHRLAFAFTTVDATNERAPSVDNAEVRAFRA